MFQTNILQIYWFQQAYHYIWLNQDKLLKDRKQLKYRLL